MSKFSSPDRASFFPFSRAETVKVILPLSILGLAWLMAPRLYGNQSSYLHKEDGHIFLTEFLAGGHLLETYTGYLHVYPRGIAGACSSLAPELFSYCTAGASGIIRILLGVLVIFYLSPYVKNKWWAAMGGGVIVFGGIGQQEVLGNITNLRWFLDIGATIALLGFYKNSIGIILASFFVIGGATSDPLALALLPVAIWRLCVLPGCGKIIPSLYLLSSAIHWIIIESSARQSILIDLIKQPMNTIEFIATRAFGVALFGETGTQAGVLVFNVGLIGFIAVIIFGIIYNISRPFIHRGVKIQLFLLVSASICFLLATVAFSATELVDVGRDLLYVSRYSLIPAIFLALFLIICLSWIPLRGYKRYLVYGTVAMLGIAAIVDSRGDEWATRGPVWSETVKVARQQCEQDKDLYSVTVPITPQNVPTKWEATLTCDWLLK